NRRSLEPSTPDMLLLLLPLLWGGWGWRDRLVTVQEGLGVHEPRSFSYPGDNRDTPVATNNPDRKVGEETQGQFQLLRNRQTNDYSLVIRDASQRDSNSYQLRVERGTLTHRPDILIPGTLESGHPRNLTCSVPQACEQGATPIFFWMSAAPTSLGPRTFHSLVLMITPRPQNHGTNLTCQATFPGAGVTTERTIQFNVSVNAGRPPHSTLDAPQNVAISIFQGNSTALKILQNTSFLLVLEGQALWLLCDADGNPCTPELVPGLLALNTTLVSNMRVLELPCIGSAEEGAQHPLGSLQMSLSLCVH
uniref:Ig-like domain-containing protein n=1 Tax=Cebus imitator TaxID=2715852 RepID=A0A2K5Q610_CEBIM